MPDETPAPKTARNTRPVVAVMVGTYLPGSKGGGPIRSVANLVAALGDEFDLKVVAYDHDLGDPTPYPGVPRDSWTPLGKGQVRYLSPARSNPKGVAALLAELDPDLVYCQSYFSPLFSIVPRVLKRMGRLQCPLLVAPRGEFSPGALALKGRKKRLFLALGRILRLDGGVIFHATAPEEEGDIRRTIGPRVRTLLARPLPTPDDRPLLPREKTPGELEAVFVSRITPKKNLIGAVEILAGVEGVRLTAYGPKEEADYWTSCVVRAQELGVALVDGGQLVPGAVRDAFARGHLFIFPTLGENYGHVIMEALSAGTPVLLSDRTPWRGLAAQGIGWDLPLGDPEPFRRVIARVRDLDAEAFAALSGRAYDAARARRDDPDLLHANRRLLRDALASTR